MGLSNYPNATDGGVLIVILVNAAMSICVVKDIFVSILHVVGIHIASSSSSSSSDENSIDSLTVECRRSPSYVKDFQSQNPAVRFDSVTSPEQEECTVCLTEFQPESEINHLPCGHIFHKLCLEKWLKYWRVTCPNCRTPMMPREEDTSSPTLSD